MARPYATLRAQLMAHDIDQMYLRELLGKSQTYITTRITGRKPWSQDDQYKLMDILSVPYDQMHILFPKNGRARSA